VIGHDASNSALSCESHRDLVSNSPNSIGCGIDVRPPGLKSKQITKRLEKALAMSDDDCKIFSASQQSPGDELLDLD
jgi:hypothetical protein